MSAALPAAAAGVKNSRLHTVAQRAAQPLHSQRYTNDPQTAQGMLTFQDGSLSSVMSSMLYFAFQFVWLFGLSALQGIKTSLFGLYGR